MKKLKRILMVITLMFCFSFGLASCISNDPNSNTGQTETGKTNPTVTAPTAKTLVYNGDAQVLINAGTTTGGKMLYKLAGGKYSEELPSVMAAGTYKVYYKVTGDDKYSDVAEKSIEVTIAKATPTITAPTAKTLTETSEAQVLVNKGTTTGGTLQYKLGDNGIYSTELPKAKDAGTHKVFYKVVGDDNYNDVAEQSIVVTIAASSTPTPTKADPVVTVPTAKTLTYTGSAQELINAGSTIGGTLQYKLDNGTYGTTVPTATNAGTYTVYYKVVGDDNYNDVAEQSIVVTIAKATPTLTAPTAKTLTYTGSAQELVNAGTTTGGTLQYKLGDNGTYGTSIPTATNVGTYTVYYKVVGNDEYNDVAEQSITVTISESSTPTPTTGKTTPAVTAPTAKTLTYTGAAQALVNAGSTTGGTLVYKLGNGTYSEDIPEATDAGTYTVYYKVVGNSNYNDVAEATVIVTITESASSHNLDINSVTGSNESIIVEFPVATGKTNEDYVVKYSKDKNTYTEINKELILIDNQMAKAYIVGLEAGDYYVRVEEAETPTNYYLSSVVRVSAQDRSGYAHFGNTEGVGAYTNEGTLKADAKVVYVTEANKNTVTLTIGSNTYTGIADILKNGAKKAPIDVRIIGTVGAAMWASPTYATSKYDTATTTTIRGNNGAYLALQNYEQDDLLDTFNVLDESVYSKLDGLKNMIKYDSSKHEFDSYYNMLDLDKVNNVTVEGIGENATLAQWGITWKRCKSIEVKNLTFTDYPEDACAFEGEYSDLAKGTTSLDVDTIEYGYYWIHNNTFNIGLNHWDVCSEHDKGDGDGATDIKKVRNATYAYNKYVGTHKTGLVGGSEKHVTANITFHHNYYVGCKSRMPYARQANMHIYNNYYENSTGTTMQIYAGAYAFVENCYFKNDNKTFEFNDKGYTAPAVKSYNNTFDGSKTYNITGVSIVDSRTATVNNGNIFYYQANSTSTKHQYSSFDTNSSIFYYDSTNQKSNVSVLTATADVPTFTVAHAGAGANSYATLELYKESSVTPTPTPTPTDTKSITMNNISYDTIAAALAAIPTNSSNTYEIVLGKGTYNENGLSYNGKATVIISGDTATKYGTDVIIKGHGSNMANESTRNLITFSGSGNIILENLTLESDWSRADHSGDVQAEVLGTSNTGYTAAYNCSFKSHQDTLRTTGKAWFYDCHIEGDVDFIWMEQQGIVALYENCEIVSVYDSNATNHSSYVVAPRMSTTDNVGKGVVIFNSTITEENSAQKTYLARTPWNSGYYNQAAFINTTCTGVETAAWSNASITTTYPKTVIGWKMDAATATSIGYTGTADVLDSTTVANEFSGRKAILNRIYNTTSNAYQKDTNNYWDIDSFITTMGWTVASDTSKDLLDGEAEVEVITYNFDGSTTGTGTVYTYTGEINGTTGTFGNLSIDATTGKLTARTSDSQFNTGAKISFVATKNGSLTITNHPGYHNYTIKAGDAAAVAATEDETTITIESGVTYVIEASNTTYLFKLIIVQ